MNIKSQRFFRVDILAGLAGLNRGQHPLEFPRAHDDRVDIFALQELVVVLVDGPTGFLAGLESFGSRQVAVAQRNDLPTLRQLVEQQRGPATDANGANADAIVGARPAAGRQDSGGKEIGDRHRARCPGSAKFQQFST
ncbi:MAG: hypothetical protein ABSG53_30945 [Thermoguttaceae bacterium]